MKSVLKEHILGFIHDSRIKNQDSIPILLEKIFQPIVVGMVLCTALLPLCIIVLRRTYSVHDYCLFDAQYRSNSRYLSTIHYAVGTKVATLVESLSRIKFLSDCKFPIGMQKVMDNRWKYTYSSLGQIHVKVCTQYDLSFDVFRKFGILVSISVKNSLICPKTKSATHCLTELFPIYQNKHWTIRWWVDHTVVPLSQVLYWRLSDFQRTIVC